MKATSDHQLRGCMLDRREDGVRVLVVEDEPKMAGLLRRCLVEEGYAVDVATNGVTGLDAASGRGYDAIVLDVMLPGMTGFDACGRLRRGGVWTPVLMLTAGDGILERIRGLDAGEDDYLTKPFHIGELFARLRALIRRGPIERPTVLTAGDLRVDPASRRCWRGGAEILLTSKEY